MVEMALRLYSLGEVVASVQDRMDVPDPVDDGDGRSDDEFEGYVNSADEREGEVEGECDEGVEGENGVLGESNQEGEGGIAEMEENDVGVEQEIDGWIKSQ